MDRWRGLSPALMRVLALLLGLLVLRGIAHSLGQQIDWHSAFLYGAVLAVAMRWPVIMSGTGSRVILISGFILDAIWQSGILTAMALILVEFGVRMLSLQTASRIWEWYRPAAVLGTLWSAWALSELVALPDREYWFGLHTDYSAFVLSVGFWMLLNLFWAILRSSVRKREAGLLFLETMRQTWWVPLAHLLVGWIMTLAHRIGYPMEVPVTLLMLWMQAMIGPIFSTMHQDRAVTGLLRLAPWQSPGQRSLSQRVMRMAYALGRSLHLSHDELRTISYAAVLQDSLIATQTPPPLWFPVPPHPEALAAAQQHNAAVIRRIEEDGVLQDVADLIRYRYAAFDGSGFPPAQGETIPKGAMVLAAANALTYLTSSEGDGLTPEEAVRWIRSHAIDRFPRELVHGMVSTLMEMGVGNGGSEKLPQTIRQLQGLVTGPEVHSVLKVGLWRAWTQLRSRSGLMPELPDEVQAVARLSTILTTSTEVGQAAQVLVRTVGELMNAKVALALSHEEPGDLNMHFHATYEFRYLDLVGRPITAGVGPMGRAMLRQEPTQFADLMEATSPVAQEIARVEGIRSVLFVPLVSRGQPIGILTVGLPRHHWFTPREVGLIHLMCDLAATVLEKARLMNELRERVQHISDLKAFTDTLLNNLSTAIIVVDPEGKLTFANDAAHRIFGELDRRGAPLPAEMEAIFPVDRALAGMILGEFDVHWNSLILAVQVTPLCDESNTLLGVVCQARDITRVRQMEDRAHRLEKMAAVAELAAGAAHEIRNPLTSIRGFMQLLQAQGREGQAEYFQIVLNEIDRIDTIIRDLLLLARPSQLKRVSVDLSAVVDEVLLLHRTEFERQSVEVERTIEKSCVAVLDAKMFRQLLINLILNAVQAMPFGGRLQVEIARTDPDQIRLQLTDSGVGIAPENLKRLFDPFFTTKEEGTGLGLALCHSIVQAHGGHIEVESKVGVGTTFTIYLLAPSAAE